MGSNLRVEGGVLDEGVDEYRDVVLHHEGLHRRLLVLLQDHVRDEPASESMGGIVHTCVFRDCASHDHRLITVFVNPQRTFPAHAPETLTETTPALRVCYRLKIMHANMVTWLLILSIQLLRRIVYDSTEI